jgi:radical SAM protein with 4Fe4S-binding SPASM domain
MEPCEGARFSGYIDSELNFSPCSFDRSLRWGVDLSKQSIQSAWFSEKFEDFRSRFNNTCKNCKKHEFCLGGCPIVPEIVLCKDYNKED